MQNTLIPVRNNNRRHRFRDFFRRHWNPEKIEPPTVDPELDDLDPVTRSCEVVRFSLLSLEWWLSPNGTLRAWLKLNGRVASVLVIPAVLVMPLVTLIIYQVAKWMGWLVGIAGNIILFPLVALAGIVVSLFVVAIIRAFFGK
jgi:hypothetical protein